MGSAVEADLRQLRLVFAIYERGDRAVSTAEIHREISDRLREELDYDREARHMALYRAILAKEADIHVPEVLPELSPRRLLTMSSEERRVGKECVRTCKYRCVRKP